MPIVETTAAIVQTMTIIRRKKRTRLIQSQPKKKRRKLTILDVLKEKEIVASALIRKSQKQIN